MDFIPFGQDAKTNFLTGQPAKQQVPPAVKSAERGCLSFFMILSIFDWISPAKAIVKEVPHGLDGWTFFVPYFAAVDRGHNEQSIKATLEAYDIRVISTLTRFGETGISVPLDQAGEAEYVLNRCGVPIAPRSSGVPKKS